MPRGDYVPGMADAPMDQRPAQYGTTGRCAECNNWLSRYNPYGVCGPCRVKAASKIPVEIAAKAQDVEEAGFAWERFPKRERVRA